MLISLLAATVLAAPTTEMGVTYATVAGEQLKLDVYLPDRRPNEISKAVILIHGGAWIAGNRAEMASLGQAVSQRGMAAFSVSYRLAPKHRWPAQLDDVQTAVRFVRANHQRFRIDPDRIAAIGGSAGAHLALMLGFRDTRDPQPSAFGGVSSRVQAVGNIFGPTDFQRDYSPSYDPLFVSLLGKPRNQALAEIRDGSPVTFITRDDSPVFTLHGTADELVPVFQAHWLDTRLKANGIPHDLNIIVGMSHAVDMRKPEVARAMDRLVDWVKRQLTAR